MHVRVYMYVCIMQPQSSQALSIHPSCDKLSNADMTAEMIFRGIEQAIRLH